MSGVLPVSAPFLSVEPGQRASGSNGQNGVPVAWRELIPFVTPYLYGMERAVIDTFDALRQ